MPEDPELPDLPRATVERRSRRRISVVWIIPILAAVVALGIAVQRILSEGPAVTIVFKAAQGLEAGKTLVKYKDVTIGTVTAVHLSADYSKVEVTAKIVKSAAGLMVEDTKFWVVQPRVTLTGVSGLGTLLSGNYLGIEAGKSTKRQTTFTGLEEPLVITDAQPGRSFLLKAATLGSLGIGAPVYYRSLQAGQVFAYKLAGDGQAIEVSIFVQAPYDKYVNPGTRFWNASGIDVKLGAGGVEVRTESLVSLLAGGVGFDTPSFAAQPQPAAANAVFTLYADRVTAMKQPESAGTRYVLYFDESLRGLSPGAPVTLLGLTAGEVLEVGLDLDPATARVRGRVEITSYPDRLAAAMGAKQAAERGSFVGSPKERHAFLQGLVERRGLRAQLRSGSLLTGQLYVALDYFPDAPKAKVDWNQEVPVFPVNPSTLVDIEAKLTGIVTKLDKLPLEAIGTDLSKALAGVDQVLQNADQLVTQAGDKSLPEVNSTLAEARRALTTIDGVLKNQLNTTLTELNSTLEGARGAIATADGVLKNTDSSLLGRDAPVQQDLRDTLQELARAARSLRVFLDYLERHPESLVRGKVEGRP